MPKKNKAYDYIPRVTFPVSEHTYNRMRDLIPHGVRGKVFSVIMDDLITLLEDEDTRVDALGAVMSGKFKLKDWSRVGGA